MTDTLPFLRTSVRWISSVAVLSLLVSCSSPQTAERRDDKNNHSTDSPTTNLQWLNRITWGGNDSSLDLINKQGHKTFLEQQLHPKKTVLPAPVAAQIAAMQISQKSLPVLVEESEYLRKQADQTGNDDAKKAARKKYQEFLNSLSQETSDRFMLRALYSPNQLQEQLTWFWMNHFSVSDRKHDIRAMIGDYEENAIRPHALGHFRDLLAASVYHPAMLTYLDNQKNVAGQINENYARELMELHTLGVDAGYSQKDVQELARILTGLGVERGARLNGHRSSARDFYSGIYEKNLVLFNPRKHDNGSKVLLGEKIHSQGKAEIDEVIDRLSKHPATAHFISRKLALYFVGDNPSPDLVERMAQTFLAKDGDISATLSTLFNSAEFAQSLNKSFKDPVHYIASSLRMIYDKTPIDKISVANSWLDRLGEPLYGHQTPDGYPLTQANWSSPGQMTARFDVARMMGSSTFGLMNPDSKGKNPTPTIKDAAYVKLLQSTMSASTQQALTQAQSMPEWNTFLLSSPEFMNR